MFKRIRGSRKGVFTVTKVLVGLILFSLFIASLGGLFYSMAQEYGVETSDKYSQSYNTLGEISNISTSIGSTYQEGTVTEQNSAVVAAKAVFSAGQIQLQAISLPIKLVNQATADLPFIPALFIKALLAIITLSVVYAVGAMLARWIF